MKRLLQSVALALATLLAAQPALATMTCVEMVCANHRSSPDCCLPSKDASMHGMAMANDAMSSMDASGQAPQIATDESGWISGPCCAVVAPSTTVLVASPKSQFSGVTLLARMGELAVAPAPVHAAVTLASAASSPSNRHVLFQVFRI